MNESSTLYWDIDPCTYNPYQGKPGPKRTSSLHAPIMLLTGHAGEVFTTKFSPDGGVSI